MRTDCRTRCPVAEPIPAYITVEEFADPLWNKETITVRRYAERGHKTLISLKRALQTESAEYWKGNLKTALDCYVGAVKAIEENSLLISDELLHDLRIELTQLRFSLSSEPSSEAMHASLDLLVASLQHFAEGGKKVLHQQNTDIQDIISLIGKAALVLTTESDHRQGSLRTFIQSVEAATRLNSLTEIRTKLAAELKEMHTHADSIQKESRESVEQLRRELQHFQSRLAVTEVLASTDPLTGASNRREGERVLEECIRLKREFCVLVFDLDHFKVINDRWGHQWGDQVLKTFAVRLKNTVRAGDIVCRWGGDEFLVILQGGLKDGLQRAKQLSLKAGGNYDIACGGKHTRITVNASVGVAEYQPGDDAEQLFARADTVLYNSKKHPSRLALL